MPISRDKRKCSIRVILDVWPSGGRVARRLARYLSFGQNGGWPERSGRSGGHSGVEPGREAQGLSAAERSVAELNPGAQRSGGAER